VTFDKLLGYTAAELQSMPAEEWQKMLDPYLHITRPDRALRVSSAKSKSSGAKAKYDAANDMLKGLGIDLEL